MAKLLEGKLVAGKINQDIKIALRSFKVAPVLASILVGDDPGAVAYVNSQSKAAQDLGITYKLLQFSHEISEDKLIDAVIELNQNSMINGIIVQMPLPARINYQRICEFIAPKKDVEGMHPANIGKLVFGQARIVACTANAVMEILNFTGVNLYGQEVVIVGSSEIIGKPLAMLLLDKFSTVTICHVGTTQAGKLEEHVRGAQILIVAVGQAGLIKGEWIKNGAIVIDVGINRVDGRIVGDVEFAAAQERASFITPVPGGVGPLTVSILMRNLTEATKLQQEN